MSIKDFFDMFTVEQITILIQLFVMFLGVQLGSAVLICISSIFSYFTNKNKYDFFTMQRRDKHYFFTGEQGSGKNVTAEFIERIKEHKNND